MYNKKKLRTILASEGLFVRRARAFGKRTPPTREERERVWRAKEELGLTDSVAWDLYSVRDAMADYNHNFPDEKPSRGKRDWISMARADSNNARYGNKALGRYYDIVIRGLK